MLPSVQRNNMERAPGFEQEGDLFICLYNLNRKRRIHQAGQTHRQAPSRVIELARIILLKKCGSFGCEWKRAGTLLILVVHFHVGNKRMLPNATEIRFSIRKTWNVVLRSERNG